MTDERIDNDNDTPSVYLGVMSDTHGRSALAYEAAELFRSRGVSCVLHCGDIGMGIAWALSGLPVRYVFGNNDYDRVGLREEIESVHQHCCGEFGRLTLAGKRIFFLHGHQIKRFQEELDSGNWDLICFGHSHVRTLQIKRNTLLLNPGALHRVARPSVAIVELPTLNVTTEML